MDIEQDPSEGYPQARFPESSFGESSFPSPDAHDVDGVCPVCKRYLEEQ